MQRRQLAGEAAHVLEGLNRDGVAVTTVDALAGCRPRFDELQAAVDALEAVQADRVVAARARCDRADAIGQKTFIIQLLGETPAFDADSAFARFALDTCVAPIANAYFGMLTRLRYYNVWHTLATAGAPRESQLWHRDREDLRILKVFVYLTDVEEGNGPFTYARGSHASGSLRGEPEYFLEGGVRRSTDEQIEAIAPRDRWLSAIGPAGTVVLADTHGYHKGGLARAGDRVLYTCMFTSAASRSPELFARPRFAAGRERAPGVA
jgi:hypothetical protein